ncbi:MAG: tryptophan synthase subunit alpha [Ktedonobacteraceae bacterium]|nr:tryptophan synthase subunit alpha [Ktedonobacteraceae bacterium]
MQATNENTTNPEATIIPAQRIVQAFKRAHEEGRGILIPYFMSGYPSAQQSVKIVVAAAEGGADIIELGMPFSDPLADGATVQHAGQIALERGMTINGCMQVAHQIAAQVDVPLILMGYYNPILAYGLERFCRTARESGVCGIIVPDLPTEEALPLREAAIKEGITLIFLIPPTAPNERIARVVELTASGPGGFIYCVSLSGVTGARDELPAHLHSFIDRIRGYTKNTNIPLAIGFGLSTPEHVASITRYVEGAVVGSALVNLIDRNAEDKQVEAVRQYIQSLAQR